MILSIFSALPMLLPLAQIADVPTSDVTQVIAKLSSDDAGGEVGTICGQILSFPSVPPAVVLALEGAFGRLSSKEPKQRIAETLVELNDRDPRYYEYIEKFAAVAIEDRTPSFIARNAEGKAIRGEVSIDFNAWCATNHVSIQETIGREMRAVGDVESLARLRDPRSIELLKTALQSPQEGIVNAGIEGLALLHVSDSISTITQAIGRFPRGLAWFFARSLVLYGSPESERVLNTLPITPNELIGKKKEGFIVRAEYSKKDMTRAVRSRAGASSR